MNELLTKIAPFVELATFIIIYLVASLLSGERDGARGGGEEHCECCGEGGKRRELQFQLGDISNQLKKLGSLLRRGKQDG